MVWYSVKKLDRYNSEYYMEFESREAALDEAQDTWDCNEGEYEDVVVFKHSVKEDGSISKELIREYHWPLFIS